MVLKFLRLRGIFTCSYCFPFEGTDAIVLRQSFAVRNDPSRSDLKSGTFGGPGILRQFPGSNCPIRAEPAEGSVLRTGIYSVLVSSLPSGATPVVLSEKPGTNRDVRKRSTIRPDSFLFGWGLVWLILTSSDPSVNIPRAIFFRWPYRPVARRFALL